MSETNFLTPEELRGLIESYLMQNSLWNESNNQPIFLLKDLQYDKTRTDSVILIFTNGQKFELSIRELKE